MGAAEEQIWLYNMWQFKLDTVWYIYSTKHSEPKG